MELDSKSPPPRAADGDDGEDLSRSPVNDSVSQLEIVVTEPLPPAMEVPAVARPQAEPIPEPAVMYFPETFRSSTPSSLIPNDKNEALILRSKDVCCCSE